MNSNNHHPFYKNTEVENATTSSLQRINNPTSTNEKCNQQFTEMALSVGHTVVNSMKANIIDYRTINEDPSLSSIDKALAKRKILACDIGITLGTVGGCVSIVWLTRKIFST